MLKLLISHWKSHRKKPTLLPKDGDIHFEDPSTVNPLYEDSDSSISSTKRPKDINIESQNQNVPNTENEQEQNENDVTITNELIDISVLTSSKHYTKRSKLHISNDEVTNTKKDNSVLEQETVSEFENVKNDDSSVELESDGINSKPLKSSSNDEISNDILSKTETHITPETEKNMRIYDQPSTSAIKRKKSVSHVADEKKLSEPEPSKLSEIQNAVSEKGKNEILSKTKKDDLESNISHFTPMPLKSDNGPASTSKVMQSSSQSEKPAKLRARAIDELIQRFQGLSPENDASMNKSQKVEKSLPSLSAENSKTANMNKTNNTKNVDLPSQLTENNKNKDKIVKKSEQKDFPKTTKAAPQLNKPNETAQGKEALSNIFKFPPPPPLEKLQNESRLHANAPVKNVKQTTSVSTSNKMKDNQDNSKESESGKTRSDSSLDRTRIAQSEEIKGKLEEKDENETAVKTQEHFFKESFLHSSKNRNSQIKNAPVLQHEEESKNAKDTSTHSKSIKEDNSHISKTESPDKNLLETKISKSKSDVAFDRVPSIKEYPKSILENKAGTSVSNNKNDDALNATYKPPDQKHTSSISKATAETNLTTENENMKSHSEDSGITRGDQISSETTQDASPSNPPEEANAVSNPSKKPRKEKKLKPINKKVCKNCKRTHDDGISMKRNQYDDYYDGLTGIRHGHRGKHSDSWTSDLSWEEKELLRKLRSRRGTVRSNTPSTRSRHSRRHRFLDENHFHRPHHLRRSVSDESSFYGSSLCSCDKCWTLYVKEYAYGRASLRGMPPIQEMCTCRTSRHNLLGRRVQFRSETIQEASPSERTSTTPAPTADTKQDDAEDDKSSQLSSKAKDNDSVLKHPDGIKDKKSKSSEEAYRFMTPWEIEEWDFFMKKHLLHRRRRRARCMGIMALAMVVFVGLVVAILMVYLRRKVI